MNANVMRDEANLEKALFTNRNRNQAIADGMIMAGNYSKWEAQYKGRVWFYGFTRDELEDIVCPVIPEKAIRSIRGDDSRHKYFIYSGDAEFNEIRTILMLDHIQIHPVGESSPGLYYVVKDKHSIKRYA